MIGPYYTAGAGGQLLRCMSPKGLFHMFDGIDHFIDALIMFFIYVVVGTVLAAMAATACLFLVRWIIGRNKSHPVRCTTCGNVFLDGNNFCTHCGSTRPQQVAMAGLPMADGGAQPTEYVPLTKASVAV